MLETLARASIDGACLVCVIWIISRALPRLSPAASAMLWWCAAAKVVVALAWVTPIGVPLLPATGSVSRAIVAPGASRSGTSSTADVRSAVQEGRYSPKPAAGAWTWVLMGLWAAGMCGSAGLAVRSWREARRVVRRSTSADPLLQECAREIAQLLALRRTPEIRLSTDVESPLITGVWRPLVLVPDPRFMALSREQQRMALCHELAHVRRGDVWLGCVPAIAERIFFFHPLVRLAAREYAFWREAACDATVLGALGTVPQAYGRLLLDLGVARPPATLAAAGAAWSFSNLKRRIVMLNQPDRPSMTARIVGAVVLAAALVAIAPLKLVARPAAAAAVPSVSFPEATRAPAALVGQSRERKAREDGFTFVFFWNDDQSTMSGSTTDIARARRFRSGGGQLLWFRKDGREYVVRDADVLREVQAIWEPVNRLGEEQGKLGTKQGELGTRQGEFGTKQGVLGTEQGRLGTRQGVLGTRQGTLAAREASGLSSAERADIERERQAIEKEMRGLDEQMRALNGKMRELDKPMRDLGEDMEVLGRQMAVLGGKMEEASREADAALRALVDKAIANGAAQAVQ
jgi:bla regulator protein blaR1